MVSDPHSSPASFGLERNNMNSAPGFQADNNEDLPDPADFSMPDFFDSSGMTEFHTPDSTMPAVWPLPVDTSFPTNDHDSEPDPPEADIGAISTSDHTPTIFFATAIVVAIIISSKFYLAPRPPAVDEASGMIARSIIEGMIRNVDTDVAAAKANYRKTQNKLKRARASLAAKHHAEEELMETIDKLAMEVKEAKKAIFVQSCRHRAWSERLDRVDLLDQ